VTRRLALLAALASALSCAPRRPAPASRAAEVARVETSPGETAVVLQVDGAAVVWFIAP